MRNYIAYIGFAPLAALGCHSQSVDPAPPVANYELASAPPGARGARAAGTDAAPPPPTEQELADPSVEAPSEAEAGGDAGAPHDPGLAVPSDAGAGVAL